MLGEVRYSIQSVSNGGQDKFTIGAVSGNLTTTGSLSAGENFVIIVVACDRAPETTRR